MRRVKELTAIILIAGMSVFTACSGGSAEGKNESASVASEAVQQIAEEEQADQDTSKEVQAEQPMAETPGTEQEMTAADTEEKAGEETAQAEGQEQQAESQEQQAEGQEQQPEGQEQQPEGQEQQPEGQEQNPEGQEQQPEGQEQQPESQEQQSEEGQEQQPEDPEQQPEEGQEQSIDAQPLPSPSEPVSIGLDPGWEFAGYSMINSDTATLYYAGGERKNIIIGVNAGHGTSGGGSVYTQCHADGTPKVTGGSTAEGSIQAMAVASGMTFYDGTPERDVSLREAQILKELLLNSGYDVLMIRESEDVQLDNIARTVICNNIASCHISVHWDGDGLDYDKGCYYMAVPDALKGMYPVSNIWSENDRLGESLIAGLAEQGCPIMAGGSIQMDLTQTSYSTIPSVDIELGNAASDHSDEVLYARAEGLLRGVNMFFGF